MKILLRSWKTCHDFNKYQGYSLPPMNEKYMDHKFVQMLETFLSRMLRKKFYKCSQAT